MQEEQMEQNNNQYFIREQSLLRTCYQCKCAKEQQIHIAIPEGITKIDDSAFTYSHSDIQTGGKRLDGRDQKIFPLKGGLNGR